VVRVLVCGGRDFVDEGAMKSTLDKFHSTTPIICLIHGAARGADTLAAKWARENGIHVVEFPALWATYGRGAGRVRNRQMLVIGRPDIILAFPGGAGTQNMIDQSIRAGIKVVSCH
jgi:hypothetical protein